MKIHHIQLFQRHIYGAFYFVISSLSFAQNLNGTIDFINDKVALADNGVAAVACHTSPASGGNVILAILDSSNGNLCKPIVVNSEFPGYGSDADVGIDDSGRISIVWEQFESNFGILYRARYSQNGSVIDSAEIVTDKIKGSLTPRISVHKNGESIICWVDYRDGIPNIYAQRYSPSRGKFGQNILIAKSISLVQYPSVRIGIDSTLYFVWQDSDHGQFHVYMKSCQWNLSSWSKVLSIDRANGKSFSSNPELLVQSNGEIFVLWKDYRTGESNIYLQRIKNHKLLASNKLVNDDTVNLWQRLPGIAGSSSGLFICVWEDYRNDQHNEVGDIYGQLFSHGGKRIGKNIKINDSPEPIIQEYPAVSMNSEGEFIVTWDDARNVQLQLFIKRFTKKGEAKMNEKSIMPIRE